MRIHQLATLALASLFLVGCASNRPSRIGESLPKGGPVVLVKQVQIPDGEPWYARFAVHTWIDYRDASGTWQRIGVPGTSTDVWRNEIDAEKAFSDERWDENVLVIDRILGDRAMRAVEELTSAEEAWTNGSYRAFPGPNSNTFIENVVRRTDGLSTQLSPNAVGKDYALFRAHLGFRTPKFEVESPWLGAELGLREGVQLHLAQLPIGVRIWPPAVLLPFAPAIGPRFPID